MVIGKQGRGCNNMVVIRLDQNRAGASSAAQPMSGVRCCVVNPLAIKETCTYE